MNADSSGLARLTDTQVDEKNPMWSPNGKRIVFFRHKNSYDPTNAIYAMNADGSGLTPQLTYTGNPGACPCDWSSDGSRLAYNSGCIKNADSSWWGLISAMNADGTGRTTLVYSPGCKSSPAWSPDDSKIAFAWEQDANWDIWMANSDGSGVTRLTSSPAKDLGLAWSPDGERIAFHSNRDGNWEVYVMNADGSGVVRLTNNPAMDAGPAWSPDGKYIIFSSDRDGNSEIYVMKADGSGLIRLTKNSADDRDPSWTSR